MNNSNCCPPPPKWPTVVKTAGEHMLLAQAHVRNQRDGLLRVALNALNRHLNQITFGIRPRLNEEDIKCIAQYAEDLRNVPQQPGFPYNIVWPETPRVLKKDVIS